MKPKSTIDKINMELGDIAIETIKTWMDGDIGIPDIKSDIYEKQDELIIEMDVPGVDAGHVECFVQNNAVYVYGEKFEVVEHNIIRYGQVERTFGSFTKIIPIQSTCDTRNIKAVLKNGVLKIILKKIQDRRVSKISIKIEKGS